MKSEQLRLYNHFLKVSKEDNGVIGKRAAKNAAEILKSFPEFEEKEVKEKKEKK